MPLTDLLPTTPHEFKSIPENLSGGFHKTKVIKDIYGISRVDDILIGFYCNEDIEFDINTNAICLGRQKVLKNTLNYPVFGMFPLASIPHSQLEISNFTKFVPGKAGQGRRPAIHPGPGRIIRPGRGRPRRIRGIPMRPFKRRRRPRQRPGPPWI